MTTYNTSSESGVVKLWVAFGMLLLGAYQAASSSILMRSDFKNLTS